MKPQLRRVADLYQVLPALTSVLLRRSLMDAFPRITQEVWTRNLLVLQVLRNFCPKKKGGGGGPRMTGKTFTIVWEELNLSLSPSRVPATKGALELQGYRHGACTGRWHILSMHAGKKPLLINTSPTLKCTAVGKVQ